MGFLAFAAELVEIDVLQRRGVISQESERKKDCDHQVHLELFLREIRDRPMQWMWLETCCPTVQRHSVEDRHPAMKGNFDLAIE